MLGIVNFTSYCLKEKALIYHSREKSHVLSAWPAKEIMISKLVGFLYTWIKIVRPVRGLTIELIISKRYVDGSKNIIWKCIFMFLQYYFLIIQRHAFKMCSNFHGIKLECFRDKETKVNICRKIMRTTAKCPKMKNSCTKHAKFWFSLSNMQICDILVAAIVVIASAPYRLVCDPSHKQKQKKYTKPISRMAFLPHFSKWKKKRKKNHKLQ